MTLLPAVGLIWLITDPFKALLYSQAFLSLQLPLTVALLVYLTSSMKVMNRLAWSWCSTESTGMLRRKMVSKRVHRAAKSAALW